jgi:hypothetical protein
MSNHKNHYLDKCARGTSKLPFGQRHILTLYLRTGYSDFSRKMSCFIYNLYQLFTLKKDMIA